MRERNERGQNSPTAAVLVFGLVIASTTVIVLAGGSAIQGTQSQLGTASAEKSMTQLDSQASLVALGQSERQVVELGTAETGDYQLNDTAGQITVSHSERSDPLLQEHLGKVYYEGGDTEVAYQGGGVWRSDGDGNAVMISPPEFHYRDATLTLPVVTLNGSEQVGDTAVFTHNTTNKPYPTDEDANPVESGLVTVSVQSEYYRAWGNYFQERTSGSVDYDHDNNTATVKLTVETEEQTVEGVIVSGGTSTDFSMKSGGEIDSYDSSVGDYEATGGRDSGTLYTAGDIELKNGAKITGSAVVEGEVTMMNNAKITGDLTDTGDRDFHSSPSTHVDGTTSTGAEAPETSSVSGLIDEKGSNFSSDNDNNKNSDISDTIDALNTGGTCDPCNLTAGQYKLEKFQYNDDGQVYLKPEGETIEIHIGPKSFNPKPNGDIEVIGDGQVKVYVEKNVVLKPGTQISNQGDDASQFWFYLHPDADVDFKQGSDPSSFTGVIYGPGDGDNPGAALNTKSNTELYGAAVGDPESMNAEGAYHYDEALADSSAVEGGKTTRPSLTYLHISENEVNVTSG